MDARSAAAAVRNGGQLTAATAPPGSRPPVPGKLLAEGAERMDAEILDRDGNVTRVISCTVDRLTGEEREILMAGCLINYYKASDSTGTGSSARPRQRPGGFSVS